MYKESGKERRNPADINPEWSLSKQMSESRDRASIEASKSRFSMLLSAIESTEQN